MQVLWCRTAKISEKAEAQMEVIRAHSQTNDGPMESAVTCPGPEQYSKQGPDASPTECYNIFH
jgi:hypothetical protein